ncbi:MAG: TrbI/VirB10 family protein [Pseudomonadota bacterium]|jgi:type IV secretion system protein VirB10|uniref:TrbI/VirB10 family protein n=1 Tax=unclassified Sphingomonas TaxID=196159 RepID=UPI0020166C3A|nr:TrbI/VirB10 family protein [Sphingomonas sp. 3F27F9]
MPTPSPVDPRGASTGDIRPVVATSASGVPLWLMIMSLVLAGVLLFSVLDSRRRAASAPPVRPRTDDSIDVAQAPPPLYIPPPPLAPTPTPLPTATPVPTPTPKPPVFVPPPPPRIIYVPQPVPPAPMPSAAPPRVSSEPVLVIDTGTGAAAMSPSGTPGANTQSGSGTPEAATAHASVIRHRETIVARGTLIPAVLESALDSTRAGPVRALVSRDVRGFDGSRVLVPRGSRLFGDYQADLQPGQNRALITWTELVRPDGVTIAIGSPASDPLGRAGVRGKVNSHFFTRFASAILQSSLDVGVNLASRIGNGNSAVVVALPGASQTLSRPLTGGTQAKPTLTVRQGTAISVFVARDLDFTAVENTR